MMGEISISECLNCLGVFGLGFWLIILVQSVFSTEALNTSGGVNQFLPSGKERVAIGTNFHSDVFNRRSGLNHTPAGTSDRRVKILRMYLRFHFITSSSNVIFSI